jgi:putative transposase
MLERIIRKVCKVRICSNRIHMYLLGCGLGRKGTEPARVAQVCPVRAKTQHVSRPYQLARGRTHRYQGMRRLDDASREILAGGECSEINIENSLRVLQQLVDEYWWFYPLRELILDHGSEFRAHRIHEGGSMNSEFKDGQEKLGLKHKAHPGQSKAPPDKRKARKAV